jgi:uncharacterized protein YrrD
MQSNGTLTGREIIDEHGEKIGKVADVFYDQGSDDPAYVQVDIGLLKHRHVLIPVDHAYTSEDGQLVVPYTKDMVKQAPKVSTPVALTHQLEDELEQYYTAGSN